MFLLLLLLLLLLFFFFFFCLAYLHWNNLTGSSLTDFDILLQVELLHRRYVFQSASSWSSSQLSRAVCSLI
jgi:hypothetical protein